MWSTWVSGCGPPLLAFGVVASGILLVELVGLALRYVIDRVSGLVVPLLPLGVLGVGAYLTVLATALIRAAPVLGVVKQNLAELERVLAYGW